MRKIKQSLLIGLMVLSSSLLMAQVTITYQALPQPGDTFALRYDYMPTLSLGSPSQTAQHWDFTMLMEDTLKYATYGITSQLPFASEFPNSNLYTYGPSALYGGPGTPINMIQWGWMMFRTNTDGMDVIGYRVGQSPNVIQAQHNVPLKLVKTPFTLDSNYSQNSQWSVLYNRNPADIDTLYTSYISSTLTCDAWGTISTPIETNVDVVRIHEQRVSVDSVYAMLGNVVYTKLLFRRDTVINYQYYSPTKRHAISTVYCNPNNSIKAAEYLYYSDLYNGVSTIDTKTFKIYPNPVKNVIKIESEDQNSFASIYQSDGRLVKKCVVVSGNIDVSDLTSGIYLLIINSGNQSYKSKFVKE
jgi:hypothetical protein